MRCPDCGARAEVLDSRPRPDGAVRRRRRCIGCDKRFTTDERVRVGADELAVRVAALALHLADDMDGVTVLDELDVFEITLTPAPANPDARVLSAKSAEPPADELTAMSHDELRAELDELMGKKSSEPVRIATFEV